MGRHGYQYLQILSGQGRKLRAHAIPGLPLHLIRLQRSALGQVCVDTLQAGNAQLADARQAHSLPLMHDDPLQVRISHHTALIVNHGDLGASGHAQVPALTGQVVDRDIHADHRRAVDAALRHGQADLAGGEKHIGAGQYGGRACGGFDEPGALAWVEVILRLDLGFEQGQRLVVETPFAQHRSVGACADALHQERSTWRRGEALQQLRIPEPADQEELTVGITDVNGAEHLVGVQALDQLRKPLQALRQVAGSRVEGQQPDTALRRIDQATGAFVNRLAQLLGGIASGRHQRLLYPAIALPGQADAEQQHAQHDRQRHQPLQRDAPSLAAHG
ncbi:hypothetical protein D3C80_827390 [compost metagenome]